jgi:hypothetical protein
MRVPRIGGLNVTPVAEEIASPFSVSFDEVVRARSRRVDDASSPVAPNGDLPAEEKKRAEAADAAWRRFEESQTEVLGVYFGTYAPTGVALTRSRIPDASGLLGRLVTRRLPMRLHIAVDPQLGTRLSSSLIVSVPLFVLISFFRVPSARESYGLSMNGSVR